MLLAHGGGQHKKAPGLVARAHRYVTACGFAVAAIEAPGHGRHVGIPAFEVESSQRFFLRHLVVA